MFIKTLPLGFGKALYSGGSTWAKWTVGLSFPFAELRAPKFDFGTARDHQYTGLDMASAQGEAADGEIQRAKKLTTDLQVKQSNELFFFAPPNKVSYFSRIWKSVCLYFHAAVAAAATAAGTKQQQNQQLK